MIQVSQSMIQPYKGMNTRYNYCTDLDHISVKCSHTTMFIFCSSFSYNPDTNETSLLLTLWSGSDSDSFPTGLRDSLGNELSEAGQNIGIEIQPTIVRFGELYTFHFSTDCVVFYTHCRTHTL